MPRIQGGRPGADGEPACIHGVSLSEPCQECTEHCAQYPDDCVPD